MLASDDTDHTLPPRSPDETGPVTALTTNPLELKALATVLDASQDGMGILRDGVWLHVNPALARQLGVASPDDLVGTDLLPKLYPQDLVAASQRMRDVRRSRPSPPGALRFLRADNTIVELEVSFAPLEGFLGACLAVTRDLTERRRLVHQFVAAERSAALGSLAASVAHGINTPLTQVFGNASMMKTLAREMVERLEDRWERGDMASVRSDLRTLVECASHLHEGVTSVAGITRAMGLFSLESAVEDQRVEMGQILDAVVDLTENAVRHRARFVCEIGVLPTVNGSEARIGHLLLTALLASVEAVPEGAAQLHEVRLRAAPTHDGVRVEITDTGAPRGTRAEHLSDPMTALEHGATDGDLALSICRSLATDMGGTMEVTPMVRGTRVVIDLKAAPRRSMPPPLSDVPTLGETAPVTRGRVLVVDDERVFLDMVCRILRLDHEVTGTSDPSEALARLERGERYDVILCDLMMPTMSGADLHAAIARFAPHVARRMLFLTAGAFTERTRAFLASGEVRWVEKPVEPELLRAMVRSRVAAARE